MDPKTIDENKNGEITRIKSDKSINLPNVLPPMHLYSLSLSLSLSLYTYIIIYYFNMSPNIVFSFGPKNKKIIGLAWPNLLNDGQTKP